MSEFTPVESYRPFQFFEKNSLKQENCGNKHGFLKKYHG